MEKFTITKEPIDSELILKGRGRTPKWPFRQLAVGEVFYVTNDKETEFSTVRSAAAYWERKLGRRFIARRVSVGLRVQRVA